MWSFRRLQRGGIISVSLRNSPPRATERTYRPMSTMVRRAIFAGLLTVSTVGCAAIQQNESPDTLEAQTPPVAPAITAPRTRELTVGEKALLADAFSAGLNEPDSIKIKWTKIPVLAGNSRRTFDYCAQLNMKDESGRYRGMQPFLATIVFENGAITGGAIASLNTENRLENWDVIPSLCQQKGLNPFG
jgi:hypothetical protein